MVKRGNKTNIKHNILKKNDKKHKFSVKKLVTILTFNAPFEIIQKVFEVYLRYGKNCNLQIFSSCFL